MRGTQATQATEAVQCHNCGKGGGTEDSNGNLHCGGCGDFAASLDGYCVKHGVHYATITGYDHCPRCRQEHDLQQQRQERLARRSSERMHSMVDAPRF